MVVGMNQPRDDLERLASYVVGARIKAGFATRKDFAAATGITARTLGKLETAAGRVSSDTLARVAAELGWTPDSPSLVMAGREPVPAGGHPDPPQPRPVLVPSPPPSGMLSAWLATATDEMIEAIIVRDEVAKKVWNLPGGDGRPLPREKRIALLAVVWDDGTPMDAERRQGNTGLAREASPPIEGNGKDPVSFC
jgi:transcriptional regulator with XRE-family HTH domain